jgi:DNA-binding MarR family transcriptional regulator
MIRAQASSTAPPGESGPTFEQILLRSNDSVGRLLALTAKVVREWFDGRLNEHGASLATWIVLSHAMAPTEQCPSQSQLAGRMGIGGATLVRHLDRLEAEGLVVRRRDDRDRRITRIEITPAGRERHRQLAQVADQVDREVKALMSDEEERTFRRVLERLGQHALTAPRPPNGHPTDETDIA